MALNTFDFTDANWSDADLRDGRYVEALVEAIRYKTAMTGTIVSSDLLKTYPPVTDNHGVFWRHELLTEILSELKILAPKYFKSYIVGMSKEAFENYSMRLYCSASASFAIQTESYTWLTACAKVLELVPAMPKDALGFATSAILPSGQIKKFIYFCYAMLDKVLIYPKPFRRELTIAIDHVPEESYMTYHHQSEQSGQCVIDTPALIKGADDIPDSFASYAKVDEVIAFTKEHACTDGGAIAHPTWLSNVDCEQYSGLECTGETWDLVSLDWACYNWDDFAWMLDDLKNTTDVWSHGSVMSFDTLLPVEMCEGTDCQYLYMSWDGCNGTIGGGSFVQTFRTMGWISAYGIPWTDPYIYFLDDECSVYADAGAVQYVYFYWFFERKEFDMVYDISTTVKDYAGSTLIQDADSNVGQYEIHKIDKPVQNLATTFWYIQDSGVKVFVDRNVTTEPITFGYTGLPDLSDIYSNDPECIDLGGGYWAKDPQYISKAVSLPYGYQGLDVYLKYPYESLEDLPDGYITTLFTN
jgi:hypothetical protein